jgi:hypothetical protein
MMKAYRKCSRVIKEDSLHVEVEYFYVFLPECTEKLFQNIAKLEACLRN